MRVRHRGHASSGSGESWSEEVHLPTCHAGGELRAAGVGQVSSQERPSRRRGQHVWRASGWQGAAPRGGRTATVPMAERGGRVGPRGGRATGPRRLRRPHRGARASPRGRSQPRACEAGTPPRRPGRGKGHRREVPARSPPTSNHPKRSGSEQVPVAHPAGGWPLQKSSSGGTVSCPASLCGHSAGRLAAGLDLSCPHLGVR